jgi:hypothetical protein
MRSDGKELIRVRAAKIPCRRDGSKAGNAQLQGCQGGMTQHCWSNHHTCMAQAGTLDTEEMLRCPTLFLIA